MKVPALASVLIGVVIMCSAAVTSWLQPTDEQLSRAIDIGFRAAKPPYHAYSFNPQKSKIGNDYREQPGLQVVTPLLCSYGAGLNAHDKLQPKPDVAGTRAACVGRVAVVVIHISPSRGANWPVVLEREGQLLQPAGRHPDGSPAVTKYTTPFGEGVGYQYRDTYVFVPPAEWRTGFSVTYADDDGKHHTVQVDAAKFEADVK